MVLQQFFAFIVFSFLYGWSFFSSRPCKQHVRLATTSAAPAGQMAGNIKSDRFEIDGDRLHLGKQLLIDQVGESVYFKLFISVFRLIQSHTQRRRTSAAGIVHNTNGRYGFAFEVFGDIFSGQWCYREH
jgi:hypothetical protein